MRTMKDTASRIARVRELDQKASPGPWSWGDGFEEFEPQPNGEMTDGVGTNKYLDCQLQSKHEIIIPIRVDHYEPIWDCGEFLNAPMMEDRELIAEYRTLAVEMETAAFLDADFEGAYDHIVNEAREIRAKPSQQDGEDGKDE